MRQHVVDGGAARVGVGVVEARNHRERARRAARSAARAGAPRDAAGDGRVVAGDFDAAGAASAAAGAADSAAGAAATAVRPIPNAPLHAALAPGDGDFGAAVVVVVAPPNRRRPRGARRHGSKQFEDARPLQDQEVHQDLIGLLNLHYFLCIANRQLQKNDPYSSFLFV